MRVLGVLVMAVLLTAHVGSPDVFFAGKAGKHQITVVVRPPEVVPGIAQVTVKTDSAFQGRVFIRPVFWRAGSKGAPAADVLERISPTGAFRGSLWLMASGAYSVEVKVESAADTGTVLVPVPSVATGRLPLNGPFAAMLAVVGLFLVTGLVNIVRKGAGEGLLEPGKGLSEAGVRTTRIAGVASLVVISLAIFGGARWWDAVDSDYQRTIYRPAAMRVSLTNGVLKVAASDTQRFAGGRVSSYVPDHGKLMHLFVAGERGFAHLHPRPDSATIPEFTTMLPPLPPGRYFLYGDVVQETGFERTIVGSVDIPDKLPTQLAKLDPDDGWIVGEVSAGNTAKLADGSILSLAFRSAAPAAGEDLNLTVAVADAKGKAVTVEPYLGMAAHAAVVRDSGDVFVHLHPMGTVTTAAQDVFAARNRGDTTAGGGLMLGDHAMHAPAAPAAPAQMASAVSFPYAFPRAGNYRVYVQVKRGGRVLTGAFAITVVPAPSDAN